MTQIDYTQKIPNNVDLKSDKRLQRALERWQPGYIEWWKEAGPTDFNENDIYLRTAISVERDGWAHFEKVKMPDYRWGIFLTPGDEDRLIGFGDSHDQKAWDRVPGDWRTELRRIILRAVLVARREGQLADGGCVTPDRVPAHAGVR